jgi:hypothetical protein
MELLKIGMWLKKMQLCPGLMTPKIQPDRDKNQSSTEFLSIEGEKSRSSTSFLSIASEKSQWSTSICVNQEIIGLSGGFLTAAAGVDFGL